MRPGKEKAQIGGYSACDLFGLGAGQVALGKVSGAAATQAVSGEGFAKEYTAVQVDVVTAGEEDSDGISLGGDEDGDGAGHGGADARGEQADIFAVSVREAAADEAQVVLDHLFDGQAGGMVAGELFA